jgi:hypothetical protein
MKSITIWRTVSWSRKAGLLSASPDVRVDALLKLQDYHVKTEFMGRINSEIIWTG